MTAATIDQAVASYVEACAPYIADLDAETRAQLRRDISEIVSEVCAELDGAPIDLVGPPERFVAELRIAAGLRAAQPPGESASAPATPRLRDRLKGLWHHRAVVWTRHIVLELRPAWWVVRGLLVGWSLSRVTGNRGPSWILNVVPHWPLFGSTALGLAATGAAIYLSVEGGRRRRPRALLIAASVVAVWFGAVLASEASRFTDGPAAYAYVGSPQQQPKYAPATFRPVMVGSDLTGDRFEVIDLAQARSMLDQMLLDAPPAAIYVEHDGAQERPGTLAAIQQVLDRLVASGHLKSA